MLMSTQANRYAHQLLEARATTHLLEPLTGSDALTLDDAYEVSRRILDIRICPGRAAGRAQDWFYQPHHLAEIRRGRIDSGADLGLDVRFHRPLRQG